MLYLEQAYIGIRRQKSPGEYPFRFRQKLTVSAPILGPWGAYVTTVSLSSALKNSPPSNSLSVADEGQYLFHLKIHKEAVFYLVTGIVATPADLPAELLVLFFPELFQIQSFFSPLPCTALAEKIVNALAGVNGEDCDHDKSP